MTERAVVLARHRDNPDEHGTFVDVLWVHESVADAEQALRDAAHEWLWTDEGLRFHASTNMDTNWGDLIQECPGGILARHGIRRDATYINRVIGVDQDEHLATAELDARAAELA